jgi:flagellar hook-associated protein 2
VTLNIAKVGSSSVTVARDTSAVRGGITGFVKAFNDFNNSVKTLTSFDPDTRKAGALLGDSTTQRIQADIRKQLSTAISGLTGNLTNLGQIGIAFQKDGSLLLDSAKLQTAISNNFDDISGLFTSVGKTSDSLIKFTSSTAATQPGTFDIKLTQLASQGSVIGTLDLRQQAISIAADTSISVTLNGTDPVSAGTVATVNIAAGEYSATNFASALQSAINSVPSFSGTGSSASVSINDSGFLEVKSSKFGSTSNISLASVGGTDISSFLGADPVSAKGTDVAGTIGDTDVTGSGQFLTGKTGTDSEGIKIEITGGGLGDRGSVIFTQGYAAQLNALASTFIGSKGVITNANDGLSSSIKSVGKSRDEFNNKLADVEKRLRAQFSALDVTIGKLNSTSSFLSQQLAALSKQSSS